MPRFQTILSSACFALLAVLNTARASDVQALDAPESAHWDAATRSWYVGSLGGGMSVARDGVGWIARYSQDGALLDARWVEGLDAPTGITGHGGRLYAVDRAAVVEIEIASRRILRTIALPGAVTPNDIAVAEDGTLYVSDMGTNLIYRIAPDGAAEAWVQDESLEAPDGLWVDGGRLLVASWGPTKEPGTLETVRPGRVLAVDLATRKITPMFGDGRLGNLDGILRVGDWVYVTDWKAGTLIRVSPAGVAETLLSGLPGLADLGLDPASGTLALPAMLDNRLLLLRMQPAD
ncbi:MAG: SMP-30/gluconolactonase/LRE family protein [Steroidobacteraceae bacterium]